MTFGVHLFCDNTNMKQYKLLLDKGLIAKRKVDVTKYKGYALNETLKKAGLLEFVTFIYYYNETLVQEFYLNLKHTITQKGGPYH
jgi:hypothetical protein